MLHPTNLPSTDGEVAREISPTHADFVSIFGNPVSISGCYEALYATQIGLSLVLPYPTIAPVAAKTASKRRCCPSTSRMFR